MKFKPGVRIDGLRINVQKDLLTLEEVFRGHDLEFVLTSTTDDSPPRPLPAHREGRAVDIRARQVNPYLLPVIKKEIETALKGKVIVKVLIAYPETARTHIHVEWTD